MTPLYAGSDLFGARNALKLTQKELSAVLGCSLASLRRYETNARLDNTIALAVECLLRRAAQTSRGLSPEERAERKFREKQRLIQLHTEAGLPLRGAGRPPTSITVLAQRHLALRDAKAHIRAVEARNAERDRQRPIIASVHFALRGSSQRGDGVAYQHALQAAVDACREGDNLVEEYLNAAHDFVVPDDSPLVTLPLEVL